MSQVLNREYLLANLSAIKDLLQGLPESDIFNRLSLQSREKEIQEELEKLDKHKPTYANIDLLFHGAPVRGSTSIEAKFASLAVNEYQEIISKLAAGKLKSTGPIPNEKLTKLHITNILHGSFGFKLEELCEDNNLSLLNTQLKTAADEAMTIVSSATGNSDEEFLEAISECDPRAVNSLKDFFKTLKSNNATVRIITGEEDKEFFEEDIKLAVDRIEATENDEKIIEIEGEFNGVLLDSRRYEFRRTDIDEVLKGKISHDLSETDLIQFNKQFIGENCKGHFRVVSITRAGRTATKYTLIKIEKSNK